MSNARQQTLKIVQPAGRQYLGTLNNCGVYLNGMELHVTRVELRAGDNQFIMATITLPVKVEWVEEPQE